MENWRRLMDSADQAETQGHYQDALHYYRAASQMARRRYERWRDFAFRLNNDLHAT